ncbi:Anaerobic sulfite reductase subunit B [subsurface metagenome]
MRNLYLTIEARIEKIIRETPEIKTFLLSPKEPLEFETGQFVQLTVPGVGEAPFTPSSSPHEKETLAVTVMKVGRVTEALHKMKKGQKVGLRGPYGMGYSLDEFKGKEILIVGGGVGLAPLRSLFLTLLYDINKYKQVLLCYGARTSRDLIYKTGLARWGQEERVELRITVDKGNRKWRGRVGLVTTLLDNLTLDFKNSIAIVCGPSIMMKFTTLKLVDLGFSPKNIYLSMERNMSCGLGQCGHCMLGKYYVCKDGPVFKYSQIKNIPNPFV